MDVKRGSVSSTALISLLHSKILWLASGNWGWGPWKDFCNYLMIWKQQEGIRSSCYIRTASNNPGAGGPGIAKFRVKFRLTPDWYPLYMWNLHVGRKIHLISNTKANLNSFYSVVWNSNKSGKALERSLRGHTNCSHTSAIRNPRKEKAPVLVFIEYYSQLEYSSCTQDNSFFPTSIDMSKLHHIRRTEGRKLS